MLIIILLIAESLAVVFYETLYMRHRSDLVSITVLAFASKFNYTVHINCTS